LVNRKRSVSTGEQMEAFEYADVARAQEDRQEHYLQFINAGSLSLGLYALAAGADDLQTPHAEDEIYYVVSGRGTILVADERRAVAPGSIVFVGKGVEHRFVDIEEDLSLLVFFAPEHRG
jgi:mannose-6-phosphate isomerase-like protein (cupin superfamily)